MTSNIKKIYTKEFKATAVKLVLEGDKMVLEAVKNLWMVAVFCTNGLNK
ncbi:MAG: hypothetical protein RL311_1256 [Bacteroidota bacterium]|jgi:transposase-like protein